MRIIGACVALFVLAPAPASAATDVDVLCRLGMHEEGLDLEVYELRVQHADARLEAAERIFKLVDDLWKEKLTERIRHLRARHDLDVALLDTKRQRLQLKRQQALMTIYRSYCGAEEDAPGRAARVEQARRDYAQTDCHRIGKDLAIAEADLAFNLEWLDSVVDLRENGVVPEQDVILAEERVEVSRREIRYHTPRLRACEDSGAAAGKGRP